MNINLTKEIDSKAVESAILDVKSTKEDSINILFDSSGGEVDAGIFFCNYVSSIQGKEVNTMIGGKADSIASLMFLSAPIENRNVLKSSRFFIHSPRISGYIPSMTSAEALKFADDLNKEKERVMSIYEEKIDKEKFLLAIKTDKNIEGDFKTVLSNLLDSEFSLIGEDIVKYGIAGKVQDDIKLFMNKKSSFMSLNFFNKKDEKQVKSEGDVNTQYSGESPLKTKEAEMKHEGGMKKGIMIHTGKQDMPKEGEEVYFVEPMDKMEMKVGDKMVKCENGKVVKIEDYKEEKKEGEEVSKMQKENEELKNQIKALNEKIAQVTKSIKEPINKDVVVKTDSKELVDSKEFAKEYEENVLAKNPSYRAQKTRELISKLNIK